MEWGLLMWVTNENLTGGRLNKQTNKQIKPNLVEDHKRNHADQEP